MSAQVQPDEGADVPPATSVPPRRRATASSPSTRHRLKATSTTRSPSTPARGPKAASANASPMQRTIAKVAGKEGQEVAEGDVVVVLDAMKMDQPLMVREAGTVACLPSEVVAAATNGAVTCKRKDAP